MSSPISLSNESEVSLLEAGSTSRCLRVRFYLKVRPPPYMPALFPDTRTQETKSQPPETIFLIYPAEMPRLPLSDFESQWNSHELKLSERVRLLIAGQTPRAHAWKEYTLGELTIQSNCAEIVLARANVLKCGSTLTRHLGSLYRGPCTLPSCDLSRSR